TATARTPRAAAKRPATGSSGRRDRGDGMLVDQDLFAFSLEDDGETIETLHPAEELAPGDQLEGHRLSLLQALEEVTVQDVDVVLRHEPSGRSERNQGCEVRGSRAPPRETRSPTPRGGTRSPASWQSGASLAPSRRSPLRGSAPRAGGRRAGGNRWPGKGGAWDRAPRRAVERPPAPTPARPSGLRDRRSDRIGPFAGGSNR